MALHLQRWVWVDHRSLPGEAEAPRRARVMTTPRRIIAVTVLALAALAPSCATGSADTPTPLWGTGPGPTLDAP
jgi:hypothetical protein